MSGKIPELKAQLTTEFLAQKHQWEKIASASQNQCLAIGFEINRCQQARVDGTVHRWAERVLCVYSPSLAKTQRQNLNKRLLDAAAFLHPLTLPPTSGRFRQKSLAALQTKVAKILRTHEVKPFFSVTYERHVKRRHVRGISGRPSRYEEQVSYVLRFGHDERAIAEHRRQLGWRLYATNAPLSTLSLSGAIQLSHGSPRIERDFARLKGKTLGIRPLYVQREDQCALDERPLPLAASGWCDCCRWHCGS